MNPREQMRPRIEPPDMGALVRQNRFQFRAIPCPPVLGKHNRWAQDSKRQRGCEISRFANLDFVGDLTRRATASEYAQTDPEAGADAQEHCAASCRIEDHNRAHPIEAMSGGRIESYSASAIAENRTRWFSRSHWGRCWFGERNRNFRGPNHNAGRR